MTVTRLVPAGVVLLALGGIVAATRLAVPAAVGTSHAAATTRQVPVTAAVRACPPSPGTGPGKVALIAAPAGAGATAAPAGARATAPAAGQAEVTPLPPAGAASAAVRPVMLADPGSLSLLTAPAAVSTGGARTGGAGTGGAGTGKESAVPPQGVAVSASGAMARAMEAEQAEGPGVGTVRCGEPGTDIWFVGPGEQNGAAQIQLDLMNIDAAPATVNVSIITDAGPVQADVMDGINVPPHTTVTESLSSLAGTGSTAAAIDVRTSAGRVAADVLDSSAHGGTPSWLPAAAPPSRTLVIPGVPPSGSAAGLFLVVPGSADAQVSVLAITPQGRYRPFGSQVIDLPGQSASYVALTSLGGAASALEITANVPVVAATGVPGNGAGTFTTATAPVSQQAVVAASVSGSGLTAEITLSAPAAAARARITEIAASAASPGKVVSVRGGHTVTVPVSAPHGSKRGSPFAVVITPLPGSGPVYAARIETEGQDSVASILPAASAPVTIGLPPVRDSYDAVYP